MLIAYICLANAGCCWCMMIYMSVTKDFVCYFALADTFKWSLSFVYPISVIDSIKYLTNMNLYLFNIFQFTAITLSSFTCLDLLLSVKNPFYPAHRRMKWYIAGTVFIIITVVPMTQNVILNPNQMFDTYHLPYYYMD